MDNESVLRKIEELMTQRGYTRYKLSKLSGVSKSTLTTIFNRKAGGGHCPGVSAGVVEQPAAGEAAPGEHYYVCDGGA